jgi:hypothetical protein
MIACSRRLIRYTGLTIDGGAETESEGPPKKDSKFDPFRTTELRAGFPLDSSGCLWRQTQGQSQSRSASMIELAIFNSYRAVPMALISTTRRKLT